MADERPRDKGPLPPLVTQGLVQRLRLAHLLKRFPERPIWALFMFVSGFISIAMLAGIAMVSKAPFIFPSLGPTAFLFFVTPTAPTASPRNTLIGHAVGIGCGYGALLLLGLQSAPPATVAGVDGSRVLAAALSLAATGALMVLLRAAHPPAGATTLIISLGIVTKPAFLLLIEVAVALLVVHAFVINRLAGIDYPIWAPPPAPAAPPPAAGGDLKRR
jgi:CBS-domain-containing membrane protein